MTAAADETSARPSPTVRLGGGRATRAVRLPRNIERIFPLIVALTLAFLFLPLHNRYWVRGGDSEVYLSLARSVATGQGYRFNGNPVSMVPPAWPMLLAGAMKLTASFVALKLLPLALMAAGLTMYACALRRLVGDRLAVGAVLMCTLLPAVFQLTYWFHAEALFVAATGAMLLLAVQINAGGQRWWRIALLAALCGVAVCTRWAGLFWWPIVALTLLHGRGLRPRADRVWLAVGLSGVFTLGAFMGARDWLRVDPQQIDPRYDTSLTGAYHYVNEPQEQHDSLAGRVLGADRWFAWLLWSSHAPEAEWRGLTRLGGWAVAGLCAITIVQRVRRRREWMWLGVAAYCVVLILNWPRPVARYFVPVAPLLIVATLDGAHHVAQIIRRYYRRRFLNVLRWGIAGSILLPNLFAYAAEVRVMRSGGDFYARYRGGTESGLLAATQWLSENGLHDGQLVVSRRLATPVSEDFGNQWMRAANLLADRAVVTIPDALTRDPDGNTFRWVAEHGGLYYLYQPRVWLRGHGRYYTFANRTATDEQMEWQLYHVPAGGRGAMRVPLPSEPRPITHVPGVAR